MARLDAPTTVQLGSGPATRPRGDVASAFATNALVVNRYYDRHWERDAVKILPGEYHVATEDVVLVTVLGSCVSACIRDTQLGIGGMNHFMLPDSGSDARGPLSESARYGAYAMEMLVNQLMKLGARRDRFEAKVFGGGNVMPGLTQANVGERNAAFVLHFLRAERIPIAARDLLDLHARKVYYFPRTGRARVKALRELKNDTIMRREVEYRSRLRGHHGESDVELFR
jgi:chemotaxis protein CheD